jgi:hypothetical protein
MRGGGKGQKLKRPGSGGGAAIRVSGECGWGDPHFSHFTGSTRHSSVGNRTGCHQSVRRGRATRYLMHAVFGCSGLAGPLAAGLGESDDDGERGCRKSDVAGGQGGHLVDPRRGRARIRSSIETPCFWMMSSNVSGLFRWDLSVVAAPGQGFAQTVLPSLLGHRRLRYGLLIPSGDPDRQSRGWLRDKA